MQNTLFVLAVLQFIQIICALNFDPTQHPNWHLLNFGTKCGESSTNRIIGGKNAALGQYPWIARIRMSGSQLLQQFGFTSVFVCGGVIINKLYILTAAHCVPSVNDGVIDMVRLGEHNVKKVIDCENKVCAPRVQDIKVDKVIKHKKYDYPYQFKNDICLLRLAKPIKFNEFVKPICPVYGPLMNKYHGGEVMDVAGWGLTNIETKETSTILKTLKITIFNAKACQKKFEGKAMIGNEQLCGGGIIGKDSCGGDSGGPLMKVYAQDGPPRYFLIGVVSFGAKVCAETDLPGVYLRVSYFMKWILDNIKV